MLRSIQLSQLSMQCLLHVPSLLVPGQCRSNWAHFDGQLFSGEWYVFHLQFPEENAGEEPYSMNYGIRFRWHHLTFMRFWIWWYDVYLYWTKSVMRLSTVLFWFSNLKYKQTKTRSLNACTCSYMQASSIDVWCHWRTTFIFVHFTAYYHGTSLWSHVVTCTMVFLHKAARAWPWHERRWRSAWYQNQILAKSESSKRGGRGNISSKALWLRG